MPKDIGMSKEMGMNGRGGHLYMQTNEVKNAIIHYHRSANGTLTEVERVATGGAGSGTFKPISGQESAPNSFEGAASVILSPDRKFLFATNGGDNSVSSFAVGAQGNLTRIDTKPTGNAVEGKSGTAKSLAYSPSKDMLYVVHSFGPDHIRIMSVSVARNRAVSFHPDPCRGRTLRIENPDTAAVRRSAGRGRAGNRLPGIGAHG